MKPCRESDSGVKESKEGNPRLAVWNHIVEEGTITRCMLWYQYFLSSLEVAEVGSVWQSKASVTPTS